MTSTGLKLWAFLFMLIDHVGVFFPRTSILLRWIGRLALPIFFYCLLWSIKLTNHRSLLLLRLYVAGLVMGLIRFVCNNLFDPIIEIESNIFTTFFITMLLILLTEHAKKIGKSTLQYNFIYFICVIYVALGVGIPELIQITYIKNVRGLDALISAIIPNIITCEGGLNNVIWGIIMYYALDSKKKFSIQFITYALLPAIFIIFLNFNYKVLLYDQYQWMSVFSLPFLLAYNGQRGNDIKGFFYIGYIAHILILFIISCVI